jgi:hypothetical protein
MQSGEFKATITYVDARRHQLGPFEVSAKFKMHTENYTTICEYEVSDAEGEYTIGRIRDNAGAKLVWGWFTKLLEKVNLQP